MHVAVTGADGSGTPGNHPWPPGDDAVSCNTPTVVGGQWEDRMMSDDAPPEGEDASGVYRPFPSFLDWQLGPLDISPFDRYSEMLAEAKRSATPETLEAAMTTAQRYAAVDTNAIEGLYQVDRGFTRTVASQAASWEATMDARGSHVRPAFQDALNAYEYVLDAATRTVEITEKWIKDLHAIICASQDTYKVYTSLGHQSQPLPRGMYKSMPNSPTSLGGRVHAYAPVLDTAPEMQRLVQELQSESFQTAHPVLQAAYAHYAYVCIHPFADGNGRVARALSSVYLYRSPGVPLIVFADQRNEYYDALESADTGDPFPFLRFMMTKTIDTIGIIKPMLQRSNPPIDSTLKGIAALFNSGANNEELHTAALRLLNLAVSEARKQMQALSLPPYITRNVGSGGGIRYVRVPRPLGYEEIGSNGFLLLHAESSWPHTIRASVQTEAFMKSDDTAASELLLASCLSSRPGEAPRDRYAWSGDGVEVWMRELVPTETEALRRKISSYIEGTIGQLLADIAKQGQDSVDRQAAMRLAVQQLRQDP
jgi:Fic family protein